MNPSQEAQRPHKSIRQKTCVGALILFVGLVVVFGGYSAVVASINRIHYPAKESEVMLRPFPYPYRAALAISNDIDNTSTLEEFVETHKFLNTREKTSMGEGIGLNIGNTFLFWEPSSGKTLSYFGSRDPRIAETLRKYLRAGQIDVIHSYGQKPDFSRDDMVEAIQELRKKDIHLDTWIDHSRSHSNMGDDVTYGPGDHPDAKEYHADLTVAYGVKFAWLGRVTMIAGQSVPITWQTYLSIYDAEHPFASLINISKEWAKNVAALLGSRKYAMHKDNDLVRVAALDNGMKIYEFMRFENNWKGVGDATNRGLAYSISKGILGRLIDNGGYMIAYTHFGKNADCSQYICQETQDALRNLAQEYRAGNIFVTTTSRLLNYYITHKYLNWSFIKKDGEISIFIKGVRDPIHGQFTPSARNLEGITFIVPHDVVCRVFLDNKLLKNVRKNADDHSGRASVTILPVS